MNAMSQVNRILGIEGLSRPVDYGVCGEGEESESESERMWLMLLLSQVPVMFGRRGILGQNTSISFKKKMRNMASFEYNPSLIIIGSTVIFDFEA